MSRAQNLYRFQKIDTNIDMADNRLKEIETLLSDNAELKLAGAKASKAEKNLQEARKKLQAAEIKVKDQRIKIEQAEAMLYGGTIRNPKELQDIQNEVAALKRFLEILEERQLEAMIAVDDAKDIFVEADGAFQKTKIQTEKKHEDLLVERDRIQGNRDRFLEQRSLAAENILPDDLKIYGRLRKQKAGVAVAFVADRACNACGSTLTAALHQAARSPSQVVFCDSCGRILHAT